MITKLHSSPKANDPMALNADVSRDPDSGRKSRRGRPMSPVVEEADQVGVNPDKPGSVGLPPKTVNPVVVFGGVAPDIDEIHLRLFNGLPVSEDEPLLLVISRDPDLKVLSLKRVKDQVEVVVIPDFFHLITREIIVNDPVTLKIIFL